MEFTGERFIPDISLDKDLEIEHLQRYFSIKDFVNNKVVLDASCGDGYGSFELSRSAKKVYGIDICMEAIVNAQTKYLNSNLTFIHASIGNIPFEDNSIDIVTSFETIEHVDEKTQHAFLNEAKRVLKRDGVLVISTPDKRIYSDIHNYRNEFHVKEFYKDEFYEFLSGYFGYVNLFYQRSEVLHLINNDRSNNLNVILHEKGKAIEGKYIIGICADFDLSNASDISSVVIDSQNKYNKLINRTLELEKNIEEVSLWGQSLDKNILERDTLTLSQNSQIEEVSSWAKSLDQQNHEKDQLLVEKDYDLNVLKQEKYLLNHQVQEASACIKSLNHQLAQRDQQLAEREQQLVERDHHIAQIYDSNLWKIANKLKYISKKTGIIYFAKGLLILRRHGLKELVKRSAAKIKSWIVSIPETNVQVESEAKIEEVQIRTGYHLGKEDKLLPYEEFLQTKKIARDNAKCYDIILFSIINWDFRHQRPQHIASAFAKNGHRVFYLNVKFNRQEDNRYLQRQISENIYEIFLPYNSSTAIYDEDLNGEIEILNRSIDSLYKDYSIKESVALVEFPMWHPLVQHVKDAYNCKVVFDVLDEFAGFSNVHDNINKYSDMMVDAADLNICTSKKLFAGISDKTDNVKLIPNATEFEYFNRLPKNDLLDGIKKPIIGYYGAIAEWFDTDTVEFIATSKPEWNLVLIGHVSSSDNERLRNYKNIHLLGEKPYVELTKYLYWFDVCLIPFKVCDLILSTNPVKFYEYISSGKPVISADLPELQPYKDLVYLANSREEFVEKIELALQEDNEEVKKRRIETARNNDWGHRVEELESVIKKVFPKVSIIVITYNNLNYTRLCIDSILQKTAYPNYEIIIVDNASTDGTRDYLKNLEATDDKVKVVMNDQNLGFAKANNKGISEAMGEYIILLNNDTVVTRGWLNNLVKHLKDPSVGIIGPVTNSIGNEARINITYTNLNDMDSFAESYTFSKSDERFEIKVLAMFCVAMRKEVMDKVGPLDEQFEVGMFEDDDYSMRVRSAGYKVLCVEDVFIHHFGGASFKKLEDKLVDIMANNLIKFEQKWGVKWEGHKYREGVSGVPLKIVCDFKEPRTTDFYSAIPTVTEIMNSFEYKDIPYLDNTIFNNEYMLLFLNDLKAYSVEFSPPDEEPSNPKSFFWNNSQFSFSDAMAYYCIIRKLKPKVILEIGSGFSTLIASEAVSKNGFGEIVCIEPYPRSFLNKLHHIREVIDKKVQDVPIDFINSLLSDGDILFIDSTHTVKVGSDCLYEYLKLLPNLSSKVMVHVHDIFLPEAYPMPWLLDKQIYWTEQYLLHALLLNNDNFKVCFGSNYHKLMNPQSLADFMNDKFLPGGSSFWFEKIK